MNRLSGNDLTQNYYKLLGVDPDAPPAIIRSAYRTMMSELGSHPDRGGSNAAAIQLNRAKEILLDPLLRAEYDRLRIAARSHTSSSHQGSARPSGQSQQSAPGEPSSRPRGGPSSAPAETSRPSKEAPPPPVAAGSNDSKGGTLWAVLAICVLILVVWGLFIFDITRP